MTDDITTMHFDRHFTRFRQRRVIKYIADLGHFIRRTSLPVFDNQKIQTETRNNRLLRNRKTTRFDKILVKYLTI